MPRTRCTGVADAELRRCSLLHLLRRAASPAVLPAAPAMRRLHWGCWQSSWHSQRQRRPAPAVPLVQTPEGQLLLRGHQQGLQPELALASWAAAGCPRPAAAWQWPVTGSWDQQALLLCCRPLLRIQLRAAQWWQAYWALHALWLPRRRCCCQPAALLPPLQRPPPLLLLPLRPLRAAWQHAAPGRASRQARTCPEHKGTALGSNAHCPTTAPCQAKSALL